MRQKFNNNEKVEVISKYPKKLIGKKGVVKFSYQVDDGFQGKSRRLYFVCFGGKNTYSFYSYQLGKRTPRSHYINYLNSICRKGKLIAK